MEEMRAQLLANEAEMARMQQSWQEKLAGQQSEAEKRILEEREKRELKKTTPHLWNLNEDPVLTGMVVYFFHSGKTTTIGMADCDVEMQGLNILKQHAVVTNQDNKHIFIQPSAGAIVVVNGKEVKEKSELFHNDRILFGSSHLYAFHHPQDAYKREQSKEERPKTPT